MIPQDLHNNMEEQMSQGLLVFNIAVNGNQLEDNPNEIDMNQREKDLSVLSVALKILNGEKLETAEEKKQRLLANTILAKLKTITHMKKDISLYLKKVIASKKKPVTTQKSQKAIHTTRTGDVTREFEELLKRRIHQSSNPEMSVLPSSLPGLGKPKDQVDENQKGINIEIETAHTIDEILDVSRSYAPQLKKPASPKVNPDSKKMRSLKKRVLECNYLEPKLFDKQVKTDMEKDLNNPEVFKNIGVDIFRYLCRGGVSFSTSYDYNRDLLLDENNVDNEKEVNNEDEHVKTAQRFSHLIELLINSLPEVIFLKSDIEDIELRKHKLKQRMVDDILDADDSPVLQNCLQALIEKTCEGEEGSEFQVISKILKSLAQNAPNRIGHFLCQAGTFQKISLERLLIEINLHHDVEKNKLYVIYKTPLKEKNPEKVAETGDPMSFLVDSKIVFSLDLSKLDSEWQYDTQRLFVGLPEKSTKNGRKKAKKLFNTFFILGLKPEYCISPKEVPEKLSRL